MNKNKVPRNKSLLLIAATWTNYFVKKKLTDKKKIEMLALMLNKNCMLSAWKTTVLTLNLISINAWIRNTSKNMGIEKSSKYQSYFFL